MREGFFGLNIAVRGLYTAQRSMDIVNHNLNNVNTPGYSRQQGVQTASNPMALFDGTGMIGTGSEIRTVNRVRDEYLDFKYWSENDTYGEWDVKRTLLSDVEATFNEPSKSGFATIMNDFYNSLQELAKDPSSPATRSIVQQRGVTLTKYFNSTATHFEKLQEDANDCVKSQVENINALGVQIQQLNRQIYVSELDGNTANDLRDQRTLLVDKLSKLINIDANEVVAGKLPSGQDDKRFVITISGKAFVDHFDISKLALIPRTTPLNQGDAPNMYDVGWEDGNSLTIKSGELRGYLDVRDGNDGIAGSGGTKTPAYKGIPYYMRKLDSFVQTFAKAFNEGIIDGTDGIGHADGTGLNGSTGIDFFTMLGTDGRAMSTSEFNSLSANVDTRYSHLTAKNFTVSYDVATDSNKIATADPAGQSGNILTLNELLKARGNTHMFAEGAPEDYMKSLVSTLGIDSQQASIFSNNQNAIVNQLTNRRASVSGVSIDEEMANLIKYQQAYNASAHMITTMAEVYDTLINKLGV